ncbi:MAG TPA: hypothetical protein VMR75_01210 [Candidatus Saccharimonadales bacterium]|nr:hypothetical protein [Candidatus Saccharimonadales bacterium]
MITMTGLIIGLIVLGLAVVVALMVRAYRSDLHSGQGAAAPGGHPPAHGAITAKTEHQHAPAPAPGGVALPPGIDTPAMEQMAKAVFEKAVNDAAGEFKQDVHGSSQRLSDLIVRLTTNVVEEELKVYRTELASARDAALESLKQMQTAIEDKQKELEQGVGTEMAHRKDYLLERLDTRLGAAVAAYIVESLGQGVDLGAQRAYLLESLERHKADLKKDLTDEL